MTKPQARAAAAAAAAAAGASGTFVSLCFLALGTGVALPWTLLRAGIVFFASRVPQGRAVFLQLYLSYYLPALPSLLLQSRCDRGFDARFGASRAFSFRLSVSLSGLAVVLAGAALLPTTSACVLALGVLVGVLDAVAYGTASQVFSVFPRAAGAAYFTGASLSSLLAVALGYSTGFASSGAPSDAQAAAVYLAGAACVLLALGATAALLRSDVGQRHLALISVAVPHAKEAMSSEDAKAALLLNESAESEELEEDDGGGDAPPPTPRISSAFAGTTVPSAWRASAEHAGAARAQMLLPPPPAAAKAVAVTLNGDDSALGGGGGGALGGGGAPGGSGGDLALLHVTWACHASLFLLWSSTVLVDSLISFVPSEGDRGAASGGSGGGASFHLYVVYASLLGELLAKQVNLFLTMRARPDDAEAAGAHADDDVELVDLRAAKAAADAPSAPRASLLAWLRARLPARPALALLVSLTVLRTLAVAPLLLYVCQPFWAAGGGGVYNDAGYIAAQFAMDFSGALLSCFAYAIAPLLLEDARHAPQSSALLALSLTAGTYAGLGAAFALEQLVLSAAPAAAAR